MSDAVKPYLAWLDQGASPPAHLSTAGWTRAAGIFIERMRSSRDDLLRGGEIVAVESYQKALDRLTALLMWVDHSGARTPRIRMDVLNAEVARINRRRERLERSAGKSRCLAILDGLLRRRRHPLSSVEKILVEDVRSSWGFARTGTNNRSKRAERMLAKYYLRRELYQNDCAANGVLLTRSQARELPPLSRTRARVAARQLGMPRGWFVAADTDLAREALGFLSDRNLRESIWRQRQAFHDTASAVSEVLRIRHEEAVASGHDNFASFQLNARTVGQVRSVSSILGNFLKDSVPSGLHFNRRLAKLAQDEGLDFLQPWDRSWLIERLRSKMKFNQEPGNSFSISTVVDRIIPELLAIGDWQVETIKVSGEDRCQQWVYDLTKTTHVEDANSTKVCVRRAQLWFAPFNPRVHESTTEAGYELLIRDRWGGLGSEDPTAIYTDEVMADLDVDSGALNRPTVVVVIDMKPKTSWVSWQELTYVIHEMGHALHDLSLVPFQHNYARVYSDDILEFPSQFLERLSQDPYLLAKWAASSVGASPLACRPMFWRKWLTTQLGDLDDVRMQSLDALVDLTLHRNPVSSDLVLDPQQVHARLAARYGVECHEDDRRGLFKFTWESYAASNYTYIFGQFLSRLLLPYRPDLTVDGAALKELFSELLEDVFSRGVDGARFSRAWRAWRGESIKESLAHGSSLYARDLNRFSRSR